nr:hypothetical protein [Tanacetum cinerariifolium]
MIVQSVKDKLHYLEQPIPPASVPAQAGVKNYVCSTSREGASSDYERFSLLQIERKAKSKKRKTSKRNRSWLLGAKIKGMGKVIGRGTVLSICQVAEEQDLSQRASGS